MSNHKANHPWVPQAARLYSQGLSVREVAARMGLPSGTVYYHLRQRGVQRRAPGQHHGHRRMYNNAWANLAESLYRQGMTLAEISKQVDRHPGTIQACLQQRGVPMRSRSRRKATWPDEARRMWQRGYNLSEIAIALDKPRDQVRWRLRQVGIHVGRTPEWVAIAVGLYLRGYTPNQIAVQVQRQAQSVRRQLRLAGVWNNPRGGPHDTNL